jgi:hypothetical protein
VDAAATARRRAELRRDRIGDEPEREARAPEVPGLSVVLADGEQGRAWVCASCAAEIAPLDEDWRRHAVRDARPIAEFFADLGMQVRERAVPPSITVTRSYCRSCAACLATDVASDRFEPSSPVIAGAPMVAPSS